MAWFRWFEVLMLLILVVAVWVTGAQLHRDMKKTHRLMDEELSVSRSTAGVAANAAADAKYATAEARYATYMATILSPGLDVTGTRQTTEGTADTYAAL